MIVLLNIPNQEFDNDVKDKFQDYFNRVKADISDGTLCGNYELETTDMFLASFKRLQVLPDNATNYDVLKAVFGNTSAFRIKDTMEFEKGFESWFSKPYKRGDSDGSN